MLMIRFLKEREGAGRRPRNWTLGPLESRVMSVVWTGGERSVRDVVQQLEQPLAYTTVMTTLDRLYKKGFLDRRKAERAFLYSARIQRREWERKMAGDLLEGFLAGLGNSPERLASFLVDAVGQHDEELLAELEKRIRTKRKELLRRGHS